MARLAARFPHYGWETNAGYGTPFTLQAMARIGITPHHRRAFAPVRAMLQGSVSRLPGAPAEPGGLRSDETEADVSAHHHNVLALSVLP